MEHQVHHESNLGAPRMSATERSQASMDDADVVRARTYGLLATLLYATPSPKLLQTLQAIPIRESARESPVAMAWEALRLSADAASATELDDEFHALFIGLGRGELVPYASWYLTGFIMEQPLAALRQSLVSLGIERQAHVREPEDHAAALCETMQVIIADGDEYDFSPQRDFFRVYMQPWMGRFFGDLQQARSARFYRAVGQLGERFIDIEQEYLSMAD